MKRGRLIFSMILCLLYMIFAGTVAATVGVSGVAAVSAHMLFMLLAWIFNIVAIGVGYGWPATTAMWLYIIAIVTGFYLNYLLVVPCACMICCGTAIHKTKEQLEKEQEAQKVYIVNQVDENKATEDIGSMQVLYRANGIIINMVDARVKSRDDEGLDLDLRLMLHMVNNNAEAFIVAIDSLFFNSVKRIKTEYSVAMDGNGSVRDEFIIPMDCDIDEIADIQIEVNAYPADGDVQDNCRICKITGQTIKSLMYQE